ncbi:collagen-like protein [Lactiplantibacillus plantarum]|uniref:collagen-like protein n=1 Tax=Lactiplantibacillus plantarum TaxID=1590 RepID=UPI001AAF95DD|nr:collagen-like protein [Lactiplantibacillus plantarum]MBO2722088.1 collagen-like protein [Lactiplantibacillus plantarum]
MTKTLEFAYETPQEVKVGDDETTFTLVCKNEDLPVDLTTAKLITVKIGNRSGYLRGQLISIDSLAELPIGQFNFSFDKDTLDNFPTGNYCLEVWVTDAQGTSIYPSGNPLNFIVTTNIENSSGATITTIAFDDFVKAMNKAASTIAKGDPGEGLDIKGQVTSVSELPTTANEGNGYLVNEELYVYASGVWKDCGTIQGPQGIQGKTGTGISSTTIQYQISNSATTSPTGTWSNSIVATTITNPYLWMKATLNYTDGTTKDFYLVSQKGDKGDKGDTGTVDNTGLTTAPAFVELKTQVDNSAVGTNLLTNSNFSSGLNYWTVNKGTNADCKAVVTTDSDGDTCIHITGTGNMCGLYRWAVSFNQNQVTTGSVLVKGTGTVNYVGLENRAFSKFGTISTESYSKVGSTMQAASNTNAFCIYFNPVDDVIDVYIKFAKLELGSHATDWSANPKEILTKSDYAKIEAAIVALGGSLS